MSPHRDPYGTSLFTKVDGSTPLARHVQDGRRARELYSYLQPNHLVYKSLQRRSSSSGSVRSTSVELSNALQPFAQLAATRCDVQRVLIIVVDRNHQYYLAEASRLTSQVESRPTFQEDEDLLWLGCSGDPKQGSLCEITVGLPSTDVGPPPFFIVKDLSSDPRFANAPTVKGPPNFRFYAGTPITTRTGTNIGTLCMFDTKPRASLTEQEEKTCSWIADQIMTYLETTREAVEGRRAKRLFDGLNHFVEGKSSLADVDKISTSCSGEDSLGNFHATLGASGGIDQHQVPRHDAAEERPNMNGTGGSKRFNEGDDGSTSHSVTYARAANLLREALELGETGGLLFVGAGSSSVHRSSNPLLKHESGIRNKGDEAFDLFENFLAPRTHPSSSSTSFDPVSNIFNRPLMPPAPILASSTQAQPYGAGDLPIDGVYPGQLNQEVMWMLSTRHPKGKLWTLDENGSIFITEEESTYERKYRSKSNEDVPEYPHNLDWIQVETALLNRVFPGVRQILYTPLWDASNSRWSSACFCWTSSETRILTSATELSFLGSFGKSVSTECSRLDAVLADKKKGDFIGSISHELRSPLHGILASVEFLLDTITNPFQKSLIDTVDACGRTLLDTINHVLDYSKINSFERNWRDPNSTISQQRKKAELVSTETLLDPSLRGGPPLLKLHSVTDIAAITEEVVEAITIAQNYSSGTDIIDTSIENRGRSSRKALPTDGHDTDVLERRTERDPVNVILDIDHGDWQFMTQPGALRRVVMNLFGNATKYTSRGSIKVRLQMTELEEITDDGKMIILTITDTGKGISPDFLSSRLFLPFAQEDTLSPGTGLGLSIVRSITNMLGGKIEIRSRVGEGTSVHVSLPLKRSTSRFSEPQNINLLNRESSMSNLSGKGLFHRLRDEAVGRRVTIYCDPYGTPEGPRCDLVNVLGRYVTDWYGIELLNSNDFAAADVIILEEKDLPSISTWRNLDKSPALIVLCSNATKYNKGHGKILESQNTRLVELVSKPCGPHKLAKALQTSLARLKALRSATAETAEVAKSPHGTLLLHNDDAAANVTKPTPVDSITEESSNRVQAETVVTASQSHENGHIDVKPTSPSVESSSMVRGTSPPSLTAPSSDATSRSPVRNGSWPKSKFNLNHRRKSTVASSTPTRSSDIEGLTAWHSTGSMNPHNEKPTFPRVLLVDDNKINLKLLQTYINKRNYQQVDSAENGQIAVNAVKTAAIPYDIIFMDISMPVLNGFEATRLIREHEAHNRAPGTALIIALTGLASGRDQAEGLAAGCNVYMTKPVSFKEVGSMLDEWEKHRPGSLEEMSSETNER